MTARRIAAAGALLLAGCSGAQSALDPAGPQSARIASLFWTFTAITSVVWVIVMVATAAALWHRRKPEAEPGEVQRNVGRSVIGATALTVVTLIGLLIASVETGRALTEIQHPGPIDIEVTGNQWWWKVRYTGPQPDKAFTTANEIRIPVGHPVRIRLRSSDVIHSLWIPNLHGKRDLIPMHETALWLQADRPGTWRAQCAEFCGAQHAHMAMTVTAMSPQEFSDWWEEQVAPAPLPSTELQKRGKDVFMAGTCPMCHAIGGTDAFGQNGPDLTHLASRPTLAAGSFPNRRGYLAAWIIDPAGLKPGARMPPNPMMPEDLEALLAYLESLK